MTVVIGTAGHIDHGKTTLLRALTGIDADRLPEERRRGMTIDVGYAHLDLDDGTSIDFVDVPGHDALIGNMLVGAGEIDAALLVVAADDGIRPQTIEHLELLNALGIEDGVVAITKTDLVPVGRALEVADAVVALLRPTLLAGRPIVGLSATTGWHVDALREVLVELRDRVLARASMAPHGPVRLSIDRAFAVKGRGAVVTGTLRGGALRTGDVLRLEPRGIDVRARGLQVHHGPVGATEPGRAAINVAGADLTDLPRGAVLTRGRGVEVSDRLLVEMTPTGQLGPASSVGGRGARGNGPVWPPADAMHVRLHLGTLNVDAVVGRRGPEAVDLPSGSVVAMLRLPEQVAVAVGDRGVIRRSSPGDLIGGIRVLDTDPPRGVARRRADGERLAELARSVTEADVDAASTALIDLHGAIPIGRVAALAGALGGPSSSSSQPGGLLLAADVHGALEARAIADVRVHHADHPLEVGLSVMTLRRSLANALRRLTTVRRDDAAAAAAAVEAIVGDLVARKRLVREGDRLRDPARAPGPPLALAASMNRLEALLDVPAPAGLADAARAAGCPPDGVRALEASGRIVRVEADLAWAAPAFRRLAAQALGLARRTPLTPAALRDATGTSRRYVMPLIEDLDRRGILARTPAGHIPGPRAPRPPDRA